MQGKDKKISHEGEYRASGLVHRARGVLLHFRQSQHFSGIFFYDSKGLTQFLDGIAGWLLVDWGEMTGLWWVAGNNSIRTLNGWALKRASGGKPDEIPDIVEFTRQRLGFDPNPLQESVLRGGRRGIVNCTRQWGKSTVAAAKAVHRAYCQPDSLTWCCP